MAARACRLGPDLALESSRMWSAKPEGRLVDWLERQAAEDPLTGLGNQRAFHRACSAEFSRVQRMRCPPICSHWLTRPYMKPSASAATVP